MIILLKRPTAFLIIWSIAAILGGTAVQLQSAIHVRPLDIEVISPAYTGTKLGLLGSLPFVGPAYSSALEDIKKDFPLLNVSQVFVIPSESSEECPESEINELAKYYYRRRTGIPAEDSRNRLTLFVFTGCSKSLGGIQQFGTGLNKVVLSSGSSSTYLTDKTGFPTLLTTVLAQSAMFGVLPKLVRLYNWTTVSVVTEIGGVNSAYEGGGRAIYNILSGLKPRVDTKFVPVSLTGPVTPSELTAILDKLKASSRIIFIAADSYPANKLLIQARINGMIDASYVYVLISPLTLPFDGSRLRNSSREYRFEEARASYSSCLLLGLGSELEFIQNLSMPASHPFVNVWKAKSESEYNYTYTDGKRVS
ncbi:hypothetical protein BV898_12857 [Hypsibius exemplaris]|uniref:Receptor ligand binding region domain-containing protein n=1 Tax=Hypsibius exemplaris TaxID=2072580 RepID=A0A1W0WCJ3_HYPEX|nr:hypothetical protein BV898_12857 [Hypsibius exemplaris]